MKTSELLEALYSVYGTNYAKDKEAAMKVDIEDRDHEKKTPLHRAVMNGNVSTVVTLLRRGADPHAEDEDGKKPIRFAWDRSIKAMLEKAMKENTVLAN